MFEIYKMNEINNMPIRILLFNKKLEGAAVGITEMIVSGILVIIIAIVALIYTKRRDKS